MTMMVTKATTRKTMLIRPRTTLLYTIRVTLGRCKEEQNRRRVALYIGSILEGVSAQCCVAVFWRTEEALRIP